MKYSIITSGYNEPALLKKCMKSVLAQSYDNFEHIIINDSPDYDYSSFDNYQNTLSEPEKLKVKYFVNKKNIGNNASKEFAFTKVSSDSEYIIFLDHDDWLYPNALEEINKILAGEDKIKKETKVIQWLVTNRSVQGKSLTKNNTNKNTINYFWDYLILKKFSGDATHTIKTSLAKKAVFSKNIKNGEEWYYFIQLQNNFSYFDINTTSSLGYLKTGVTALIKNKYTENTWLIWKEILSFKNIQKLSIFSILKIIFYLKIRTLYSMSKAFKKAPSK